MDMIMGRYKVSLDGTGLVLTHPTGISFDVTWDEASKLAEFVAFYQNASGAAPRVAEQGGRTSIGEQGGRKSIGEQGATIIDYEAGKRRLPNR